MTSIPFPALLPRKNDHGASCCMCPALVPWQLRYIRSYRNYNKASSSVALVVFVRVHYEHQYLKYYGDVPHPGHSASASLLCYSEVGMCCKLSCLLPRARRQRLSYPILSYPTVASPQTTHHSVNISLKPTMCLKIQIYWPRQKTSPVHFPPGRLEGSGKQEREPGA